MIESEIGIEMEIYEARALNTELLRVGGVDLLIQGSEIGTVDV